MRPKWIVRFGTADKLQTSQLAFESMEKASEAVYRLTQENPDLWTLILEPSAEDILCFDPITGEPVPCPVCGMQQQSWEFDGLCSQECSDALMEPRLDSQANGTVE